MPVDMKRTIAETFGEMARRKSVDKITVKDLVEACGISRQTFYYHFQDLMEVIEWSAERAMERTLEQSLAAGDPRSALGVFVEAVAGGRWFIEKLLRSQRREQVEVLVLRTARTYLKELFRQSGADLALEKDDYEALLDFYAAGMVGLLIQSCGRAGSSPQRVTGQLYRLLSGQMLREGSRKDQGAGPMVSEGAAGGH